MREVTSKMIDERFSKEEFLKHELNSPESLALHKALEAEIAEQLHLVVREKFREISERLGDLGHNLTEADPEYDSEFSSWNYEYNDDSDENSPRIWLNTQTGVMSGYVESEEVIA